MKLLALESSANVASVAIVEDDKIIAEYSTDFKMTHSQTLLPMINEIVNRTKTDKKSFDAIAIASGPGSFTGLRIGSATAKGIAMALDIPIVSVPTLKAMAMNLLYSNYLICPIMDARRDQVYTAIYESDGKGLSEVLGQSAMAISELVDILNKKNKAVCFLGDGVPRFKDIIDDSLNADHIFVAGNLNRQRAGSVGILAMEMLNKGQIVSADDFKPEYLRLSQAERELKEKQEKESK